MRKRAAWPCLWLRRMGLLLGLLLALPGLRADAAEITVSAVLQPQSIALGENAQLSLIVNGSQKLREPPQISVDGAQVQYLGPSMETMLNNFELTVKLTHRYLVTPKRTGDLEVPAIAVEIGGTRYQTEPLVLRVTSPGNGDASGPGEGIHLTCPLPSRPVYVGEVFPVLLSLNVPSDVQWKIERMPELVADAFTKAPFPQPQQRQVVLSGRAFDVMEFRTVLTAIKSGELPVGPIGATIQVATQQRRNQQFPSAFGNLFGGFPFDNPILSFQEKRLQMDVQTLVVQELPAQGRPVSFSGAVGRFRARASCNQSKVKQGEPLTVTVTVEGEGNFDRMDSVALVSSQGWRAYPPEVSFTKQDEFGVRGVKTFRIAVVPEAAQQRTPQFEFSAFDPETGQYVKQALETFPLEVEGLPAAPAPKPQPQTAAPSEAKQSGKTEEPPRAGIIETNAVPAGAGGASRSAAWFWGVQGVLLLGLIFWGVTTFRAQLRAKAGPGRALNGEAALEAERLEAEETRLAFFQKAMRVVQLRAAARSGQPPAAVDATSAVQALGLHEKEAGEVAWLFEQCADARFGGGQAQARVSPPDKARVLALVKRSGA